MNAIGHLPFSQATKDVFKMMLDVDINEGNSTLLKDIYGGKTVNVVIGLKGDVKGTVLYTFPENMTLEMVKIMVGMEMEEVDEMVTSALGEMANIISGNALTNLSAQNLVCDITPPEIVLGDVDKSAVTKSITVPMQSSIGNLAIDVAFLAQ